MVRAETVAVVAVIDCENDVVAGVVVVVVAAAAVDIVAGVDDQVKDEKVAD